uniref:Uncharacterized protein n=1 Tax=Candidatus Kentrum sp. LPFa TaxID=2126335 RepID=A0A450W9D9_9GAMM|nr:MAG: hypothetical protein BECKLPF1236A_GA0070988_100924 [Candidatus Kentron sp. LPFa]VFK31114.1 MAG: hypothetical protein BECKLPF1236C_GA0070990_101284 [Candidatus Kentron sp. LPFa]
MGWFHMKSKTSVWSILGVFGTWLGAMAIVWVLHMENDWNSRKEAMDIIKQVDDDLNELRDNLEKYFPELFSGEAFEPLSSDDAENLFFSCTQGYEQDQNSGRVFQCEARKTATKLLNHFEDLTISYMYKLGNREMLEEAWSHELARHFMHFENFVKTVRHERKAPKMWISIDKAIAEMGGNS